MTDSSRSDSGLRNRPPLAVAYILASTLLLVGMDGIVKWLADDLG